MNGIEGKTHLNETECPIGLSPFPSRFLPGPRFFGLIRLRLFCSRTYCFVLCSRILAGHRKKDNQWLLAATFKSFKNLLRSLLQGLGGGVRMATWSKYE